MEEEVRFWEEGTVLGQRKTDGMEKASGMGSAAGAKPTEGAG